MQHIIIIYHQQYLYFGIFAYLIWLIWISSFFSSNRNSCDQFNLPMTFFLRLIFIFLISIMNHYGISAYMFLILQAHYCKTKEPIGKKTSEELGLYLGCLIGMEEYILRYMGQFIIGSIIYFQFQFQWSNPKEYRYMNFMTNLRT